MQLRRALGRGAGGGTHQHARFLLLLFGPDSRTESERLRSAGDEGGREGGREMGNGKWVRMRNG